VYWYIYATSSALVALFLYHFGRWRQGNKLTAKRFLLSLPFGTIPYVILYLWWSFLEGRVGRGWMADWFSY
jgi:hypothetical protein